MNSSNRYKSCAYASSSLLRCALWVAVSPHRRVQGGGGPPLLPVSALQIEHFHILLRLGGSGFAGAGTKLPAMNNSHFVQIAQ